MEEFPTRFLVVSLGSIGQRHLRNLRSMRADSKIAVLRRSGAESSQSIAEADVVVTSIEEAIRFAPDAAIIASPASAHEETARELAAAGIHLLIEKPLARDVAEANRIVDAVSAAGVTCMVGYNLRFTESLIEVRSLLAAGRIGTVLSVQAEVGQYLPSWRPQQDYRLGVSARAELGGGALLELSHEIDYLLWLFGMPDRVHCSMGHYSTLEIDVEDLVHLTMEYKSPYRLVTVHLDFLQRKAVRQCRFIGSLGTMIWNAIDSTIRLEGMANGARDETCGPFACDADQSYLAELDHFIRAIAGETKSSPDLADGRDVLTLVDAARLSAANGTTITIQVTENAR